LTFDSDHPDVHVYAHLPTSALFWGETQSDLYRGFFLKIFKKFAIFLRKKKEKTEKKIARF
jgi:hypothetical protein